MRNSPLFIMWPVFFPFFLFHVFQPGVISKLLNAKHVWNITAYRPYRGHVFHAIFMRLLTVDVRRHVELASRKQHGCYSTLYNACNGSLNSFLYTLQCCQQNVYLSDLYHVQ